MVKSKDQALQQVLLLTWRNNRDAVNLYLLGVFVVLKGLSNLLFDRWYGIVVCICFCYLLLSGGIREPRFRPEWKQGTGLRFTLSEKVTKFMFFVHLRNPRE